MVVAMVTVWVVKSSVDDVVDMVTMGNRLVSATGAVDMRIVMPDRLTLVGIRVTDVETVLIVVIAVFMMHVPVMQVVSVAVMDDFRVATVFAVHMIVMLMDFAFIASHRLLLQVLPPVSLSIGLYPGRQWPRLDDP